MKTTSLTQQEREVIALNDSLGRYLESLSTGRAATPRSWLYEGDPTPEVTLDNWMRILGRLKTGTEYEREVYQFDISQLEKWGPQGQVAPLEDLMPIVEEGFMLADSKKPPVFNSQEWQDAKEATFWDLNAFSLRPASYQHVLDDMRARDTLESNSGWPLFQRRNSKEVVAASISDAEDGSWKRYPAIALFRNYNQKTRLVWMFPMSTNLVEGSFFQPLQSAIIKSRTSWKWKGVFAPWFGFEACRKEITQVYRDMAGVHKNDPNRTVAASDFASTDAHFTIWHTLEVYDIIKHCFQKQYWTALRESLVHMHSIPLVIGKDSQLAGLHGVSSGSNWTNFVETIFDIAFGHYVALTVGQHAPGGPITYQQERTILDSDFMAKCMYAIGDDMTWLCDRYDEKFAELLEEAGREVGHVIKAEKTTNYYNKVKTLQRLFQRGYNRPDSQCRGVYSTVRALKSSVYPERFHKPKLWSSDMFCARQFMILENCVDHPLFEEFVQFVCRGQKDLIPFAKNPASKLKTITRETKLLPGFNPTYNQEKRDQALSTFQSVDVIRSM
nr:RNA-dependent RNA polymerase [Marmot picobirnavirus]